MTLRMSLHTDLGAREFTSPIGPSLHEQVTAEDSLLPFELPDPYRPEAVTSWGVGSAPPPDPAR